ncbi:MAG: hypothetical protein D6731_24545 [Planctomycetota bacterium]|nr:MAG: hypothetical protein D6731_24545 [Planctomycetota bacterium]
MLWLVDLRPEDAAARRERALARRVARAFGPRLRRRPSGCVDFRSLARRRPGLVRCRFRED